MDTSFRLFPESASTTAQSVDPLYFFLLAVSAFFTLGIFLCIAFFVIRYRRGSKVNRTIRPSRAYVLLELTWSIIPLLLSLVMFVWGAKLYILRQEPPVDALEINVIAKQWMWKIGHAAGKQEINVLHVPVGRPIRLRMISEDVIHSFYVPAFRVKQDVLPGRYTSLWFEPTRPGRYHLFCAEYCGTEHSKMIGEVVALEPTEFAAWLEGGTGDSPAQAGRTLFEQLRCSNCHANPADPRGPELAGVYGRVERLSNGTSIVADDSYLRESIVEPGAKVVAGYTNLMPSFKNQLSESQLFDLLAYLKSLVQPTLERPAAPPGEP